MDPLFIHNYCIPGVLGYKPEMYDLASQDVEDIGVHDFSECMAIIESLHHPVCRRDVPLRGSRPYQDKLRSEIIRNKHPRNPRYIAPAATQTTTPNIVTFQTTAQVPPPGARDFRVNKRGRTKDKHRSYVRLPANIEDTELPAELNSCFKEASINGRYLVYAHHFCLSMGNNPQSLNQLVYY